MWKSSARRLAAWKAAWSITLRLCEHGWSTTYKAKGCSNFRFVEPNNNDSVVSEVDHPVRRGIMTRPFRPLVAVRVAGLTKGNPIAAGQYSHRLVSISHLV